MKKTIITSSVLIVILFAVTNCGGGGGGGGSSFALQGSWYGILEDTNLDTWIYSFSIDSSGKVTQASLAGSLTGVDGTASCDSVDVNQCAILFDNASGWLVMPDNLRSHMVLVDPVAGNFGVLQKGAVGLPLYGIDDILGTWNGFAYFYSTTIGDYVKEPSTSAVISAGLTAHDVVYTDSGGAVLGSILLYDSNVGGYYGDMLGGALDLVCYESADKFFAGCYIGDILTYTWPEDYYFMALTKQ